MVVNLLTTNLESFAMKVLSPITSHVRALHNKMVLCHVLNRVLIRPIIEKIPYELLKGRKPNISYFRVFGCKFFILNNGKDKLGKFDDKDDEGIFLGYSSFSKAYMVFNNRTLAIEEYIHVYFDETKPQKMGRGISSVIDASGANKEDKVDDDVPKVDPPKDEYINDDKEESEHEDDTYETSNQPPQYCIVTKDHSLTSYETSKRE